MLIRTLHSQHLTRRCASNVSTRARKIPRSIRVTEVLQIERYPRRTTTLTNPNENQTNTYPYHTPTFVRELMRTDGIRVTEHRARKTPTGVRVTECPSQKDIEGHINQTDEGFKHQVFQNPHTQEIVPTSRLDIVPIRRAKRVKHSKDQA